MIGGPIKPKTQLVANRQPYTLAPAQTASGQIGKFAIVEQHALTQAIFVGPSWQRASYKVGGMDAFLSGWDGSSYANALTEYLPHSKGSINYAGFSFLRNIPASEIVEQVMLGLKAGRYQRAPDGERNYFVVFMETPATAGGKDASEIACAENTFVSGKGSLKPVYFSFIYNLDRYKGCAVSDHATGHPPELAALAATTARAIANTLTDPTWSGWQDGNFNEVADKCAWQYQSPYVTFSNGTLWKLPELWSDRVYITGLGYPDANGQRGCIQGE
jgi:hypothetical protein